MFKTLNLLKKLAIVAVTGTATVYVATRLVSFNGLKLPRPLLDSISSTIVDMPDMELRKRIMETCEPQVEPFSEPSDQDEEILSDVGYESDYNQDNDNLEQRLIAVKEQEPQKEPEKVPENPFREIILEDENEEILLNNDLFDRVLENYDVVHELNVNPQIDQEIDAMYENDFKDGVLIDENEELNAMYDNYLQNGEMVEQQPEDKEVNVVVHPDEIIVDEIAMEIDNDLQIPENENQQQVLPVEGELFVEQVVNMEIKQEVLPLEGELPVHIEQEVLPLEGELPVHIEQEVLPELGELTAPEEKIEPFAEWLHYWQEYQNGNDELNYEMDYMPEWDVYNKRAEDNRYTRKIFQKYQEQLPQEGEMCNIEQQDRQPEKPTTQEQYLERQQQFKEQGLYPKTDGGCEPSELEPNKPETSMDIRTNLTDIDIKDYIVCRYAMYQHPYLSNLLMRYRYYRDNCDKAPVIPEEQLAILENNDLIIYTDALIHKPTVHVVTRELTPRLEQARKNFRCTTDKRLSPAEMNYYFGRTMLNVVMTQLSNFDKYYVNDRNIQFTAHEIICQFLMNSHRRLPHMNLVNAITPEDIEFTRMSILPKEHFVRLPFTGKVVEFSWKIESWVNKLLFDSALHVYLFQIPSAEPVPVTESSYL